MADVLINKFNDRVAIGLGEVLWSWQRCDGCQANMKCQTTVCSSYISRAKRYMKYYEALVLDYHDELPLEGQPFKTHGDIWKAILLLTTHPELTRAEFSRLISAPSVAPVNHNLLIDATTLVVKIVCMTDCSSLYYSPRRLEEGNMGLVWGDQTPFEKYLQDLFATQSHPVWSSQHGQNEVLCTRRSRMRATKLRKHLGLTVCPTHEIRDHLRLDTRRNEIKIFHYTSFIKENLKAKRNSSVINLLPRQLLLEILDSTQRILFPLSDAKSRKLLRHLISNSDYAFDPEIEKFELSIFSNPGEENIPYVYLAERLEELFQELQSPKPRTWLDKQMQRRSGARYSEFPNHVRSKSPDIFAKQVSITQISIR
ncbi:hypothetical protein F5B22DRAFT_201652 [Xylaria bambusicola]|uniref:uncharacterized protein n=1 Tax=Xylaria bambusicola TaxID=326684 RepID=UPI0020080771|nr:uncharacterized protein F5B22DRAFT_201652 [Xylaria bambusicola]KAI0515091.1 hypothetical protein F5B22DRAFT_201652 [Xylaria bambusicola]